MGKLDATPSQVQQEQGDEHFTRSGREDGKAALALLVGYLFPNGRFVPRWTSWLALLVVLFVGGSIFFPTAPFNLDIWPAGNRGTTRGN